MAINIGSHLGEETLELYALGRLAEHLVPSLEEHLLLCETCRERLDTAETFIQVVATAARELQQEPQKPRSIKLLSKLTWLWTVPKPVWVGALAAIALMVAIPYYHWDRAGAITEVRMSTARGMSDRLSASAKSGRVLLVMDTSELPALAVYRLRMVDSRGWQVWQGSASATNQELRVQVPVSLKAGDYWVRLYSPDGVQLREMGLNVN